mgnify:CR=1 FL=1
MNWNKDKSVKLSKFCVCLFMLILAGVCIGAPWLFRLLIRLRVQDLAGKFELFLVSTYTAAVPAAAALYGLWRLLRNISEGEVFIPENVSILRLLSWCCIAAGLVCLFSALYYMPFLIVSAAAAFVGLILRVVKNVFAEAVRLKGELAERVGITPANLSILKNNKAKAIRFSTLEALCKALDCKPADILDYTED